MRYPPLLLDSNNKPVPQVYDPRTNEFKVVTTAIVRDAFSGSSNTSKTYETDMRIFAIINTGTADLTFTINGLTIPVKVGKGFEDEFEPFKTLTITATSSFDAIVKG